ncbi:glycosyltransferase [Mesonia mobilis]|mgnify:CR=1 FL=1|uniref:Rhamnosyl transferase n=1 Tax=Mesonia mobilis TaxID=369791 RepID=A0ABQ3BPF0_9FLAO|nr:glycosyltransferase [Mesonia mobilis]MBQ0738149.1 hypothetical protein [Aquimarina celericrescens]GGZ53389.1 hypothetical protein GCM10008088_13840 [Mesonia mobilis]
MNHFLITRFNVKIKNWKNSKKGEEVLTDKWLKERFFLFETYCLPSVKNQSNLNFKWFVFFDKDTPEIYKNRIQKIANNFPNFIPVYIQDITFLNSSFKQCITNNIIDPKKNIITTRLDNDDLIHREFIETIQKNYVDRDGVVIDLRRGYQVALGEQNDQIRIFDFPFNPFVSYIEKYKENLQTVMYQQHRSFKYNKNQLIIDEKPLWIELVHESNKYNTVRQDHFRIKNFNNKDFGISTFHSFKEDKGKVFFHNFKLSILKKVKRIKKKF